MPNVEPSSHPATAPASHIGAGHLAIGNSFLMNLLAFLAILAFTFLFVWAFYAIKRALAARGRRELGLPLIPIDPAQSAAIRMPPNSLVLLSASTRPLSRELVAAAIRQAWGIEELSDDESADAHWVFGQTEQLCTVSVNGTVITIVSLPDPYKKDRDWYVTDNTPPELLTAWQQHRAWLSIDMASAGPITDHALILTQIARLAAELSDEDTLALVRPAARQALPFSNALRRALTSQPATALFATPPVSIILHFDHPPQLTQKSLAARLAAAWSPAASEFPLIPPFPGANFCALSSENGGTAFLQFNGLRFTITSTPASSLTLTLTAAPVGIPKSQIYSLLLKLTAQFASPSLQSLHFPDHSRTLPYTPALLPALQAGDLPTLLQ